MTMCRRRGTSLAVDLLHNANEEQLRGIILLSNMPDAELIRLYEREQEMTEKRKAECESDN